MHRGGYGYALDRDVLERRGVGKTGDQAERRFPDPRADAIEEAELPDRRVDRLLVDELLHLVEDRAALLVVELVGLLRIELVDVGVAAIDIGAALDDKGLSRVAALPKAALAPWMMPRVYFLSA